MSTPLLSTKLYLPPARPDAIPRPRLSERLLAGASRPGGLVLLSGPAGFGKTTLLSEFLAQSRRPAAWLSLDEGDNDPIRFWTYLIAACQSAHSGVGEAALALFHTPQPLPVETVPTILVNDLARLGSELLLVLDDFHVIQYQAIHAALAFLLDHLPGNLHIVLSTRSDPPWPLARLRARNQLTEIRAADLRFTTAEAAAFLNQMTGLDLSAEDLAALEARTEGWVAGLQLAALSMIGRSDIPAFVRAFSGSHVYVAEYLVEEVLQRQPEEVQSFLLQTSILERLNAGLCQAVSGRQDAQAMLTALQRGNLFILALDDVGGWFRYHHLFADLLQALAQQSLPAEAITALHGRAAAWYEQHGLAAEAISHALAAKDYEAAARLVEQNAFQVMTRGEMTTLLRWIAALPADVTRHHPIITIAQAWTLTLTGAVQQVETLLQQAEARFEASDRTPAACDLRGNAAAIRAFFAMLAGDHRRALELAERAEALLPESSVQARSLLPYILGSAYRAQGQYEKAAEAFGRQAQMGEAHHDLFTWATGMTEVVNVRHAQGRLRLAAETGRQALNRMAGQGALPFGSLAKLEVALCDVLREQNELEEASQRLADVIGRMQAWDMPTDRLFAYLALARVQAAQGDFASAWRSLQMAKDIKASQPVLLQLARAVDLLEIRLALASGDLTAANQGMEARQPGASPAVTIREQEQLTLARLRLAQGRAGEAATILAPLAREAEAGGRGSVWLECLVLQGRVLDGQGNREAALEALLKALALAEPEGFVRVFTDEGEALRPLLAAAASRLAEATGPAGTAAKAYVAKLIEALHGDQLPAAISQSSNEVDRLAEPLTAREIEVLRLIAGGDSNQTIADRLVITVSAVKKHAGHIFAKLNVNSRTQAVARARQLGLLPADE